jgi:hypothetical protein
LARHYRNQQYQDGEAADPRSASRYPCLCMPLGTGTSSNALVPALPESV